MGLFIWTFFLCSPAEYTTESFYFPNEPAWTTSSNSFSIHPSIFICLGNRSGRHLICHVHYDGSTELQPAVNRNKKENMETQSNYVLLLLLELIKQLILYAISTQSVLLHLWATNTPAHTHMRTISFTLYKTSTLSFPLKAFSGKVLSNKNNECRNETSNHCLSCVLLQGFYF